MAAVSQPLPRRGSKRAGMSIDLAAPAKFIVFNIQNSSFLTQIPRVLIKNSLFVILNSSLLLTATEEMA